MLLYMAVMLTVFSAVLEIRMVKKMPWLHRLFLVGLPIPFTGKRISGDLLNTGFSLGLSGGLGMLFGATGLSMAFAGIASTVVTAKWYWAEDMVKTKVHAVRTLQSKYAQPLKDLATVVKWGIMITTSPFRACRWALLRYHIAREWVVTFTEKVKLKLRLG